MHNTTHNHDHHKHHEAALPVFERNPFVLIFRSFSDGLRRNQNAVVGLLVASITIGIVNQLPNMFSQFVGIFGGDSPSQDTEIILGVMVVGILAVATLLSVFMQVVWNGFSSYVGVRNASGLSVNVSEALQIGFKRFFAVASIYFITLLIGIVWLLPAAMAFTGAFILLAADQREVAVGGFIASGVLLLFGIVMSVRAQLKRSLATFILFEENQGSMSALSNSIAITKNRLVELLGISFASAIIPVIGSTLYAVGMGTYYKQLKQYRDAHAALPKTHILSWLPLILLGSFLVFILLIAAVIVLINLAK